MTADYDSWLASNCDLQAPSQCTISRQASESNSTPWLWELQKYMASVQSASRARKSLLDILWKSIFFDTIGSQSLSPSNWDGTRSLHPSYEPFQASRRDVVPACVAGGGCGCWRCGFWVQTRHRALSNLGVTSRLKVAGRKENMF